MSFLDSIRRRFGADSRTSKSSSLASRPDFLTALTSELAANLENHFGAENWDPNRFGPYDAARHPSVEITLQDALSGLAVEGLQQTYDLLSDDYSKSTFVQVLAYRLLGHEKVRLQLNTPEYWARRDGLQSLFKGTEAVDVHFLGMILRRMDLHAIGLPIEMYLTPPGVMNTFVLKQYEYDRPGAWVAALPGDYVIDGGGCWGDTALFFANQIGETGRVFSFEFMPANIVIHERNVDLNPALRGRIEIVPRALWDKTGEILSYLEFGPATRVHGRRSDDQDPGAPQVRTLSIDDLVTEANLPRVDFIKMDIEGAELAALQGAEKTLRAFAPKLAISIYHKASDFVDIPRYLQKLGLSYHFYLDHFTIYGEETVLFATTETASQAV